MGARGLLFSHSCNGNTHLFTVFGNSSAGDVETIGLEEPRQAFIAERLSRVLLFYVLA